MMTLNIFDVSVIMATAVSAVFVLLRGMTRESITIVTWVAASYLSVEYSEVVGEMFNTVISTNTIKKIIGGSLIFIGLLIIGGILNAIIGKLIKISKLVVIDKILGAVFGILRGILVLLVLILLVNDVFVNLANEEWWKGSMLVPKLQPVVQNIKSELPKDWIKKYTEFADSFKT